MLVRPYWCKTFPPDRQSEATALGPPSQAPSFNAGVLVIDLKRWRERSCVRLVAEWPIP